MARERITSPQNPSVKRWVQLQKDGKLRRERGEFVVEGKRLVSAALELGRVRTFLFSEKYAGGDPLIEKARAAGVEAVELSMAAFRKVADVQSPQGVAAVVGTKEFPAADFFCPGAFLLVACGVQDPGNLGSMMRSAHAAGATGFVALPPSTDLHHPRAVRGSAGAVMSLPAARMKAEDFLARAGESGLTVLAAAPRGGVDFREADYSRPVAIAVGSEAHGVPEDIASHGEAVTIPTTGAVESLNAAAAAAVILFEAARRRVAAEPPSAH
jgi:TrmH family RNA methyltransferase